eukprot:m.308995 g.308995  ORF g.308995 m.308995 type:complete len:1646 (+) comp45241_c0_seq1:82-5019(+)
MTINAISLVCLIFHVFVSSASGGLPQEYEVVIPRRRVGTQRSDDDFLERFSFRAFGEDVELHLRPDDGFFAGSLSVERIAQGGLRTRMNAADQNNLKRCFYTGSRTNATRLSNAKTASFNLCGGLMGAYRTDAGQFFVEPLPTPTPTTTSGDTDKDEYERAHAVYRHNVNGGESCTVRRGGSLASDVARAVDSMKKHRRRRSTSMENYIETLVVADEAMHAFYGDRIVDYLMTVMNLVSVLFSDPSLGNYVNVVTVRVLIMEMNPIGLTVSRSSSATLSSFCRWQMAENKPEEHDHHHDVAVLFTKADICMNGRCSMLGLAELGAACNPLRSCVIVEDTGVSSAYTAAHEMGHLLNMEHDDVSGCHLESKAFRIMASSLSLARAWAWSECSRNAITRFLDEGKGICLLNRPRSLDIKNGQQKQHKLPGEMYSLDEQCQMVFGKGVTHCGGIFQSSCKRLWCSNPTPGCRTLHMPWADGTPCGRGKWCQSGECKSKTATTSVERVDGQWGDWSSSSPCSRSCGGGLQFRVRECDNPRPSGGGQFCTGMRREFKSCATNECPANSVPFRQVQCSEFNTKSHSFNDLPPRVQWQARYPRGTHRCRLVCSPSIKTYRSYVLASSVIDGTPCSPGSFDVCLAGQCRPAGCDHILGSDMKLDRCGVCGGRGDSCTLVTGSVDQLSYGYNRVTTFPHGATGITVRQTPLQSRDDNYLAASSKGGRYIFNGNYVISLGRSKYQQAGTTWYYNGSQIGLETLTASGPLDQAVTLLVLSVGSYRAADIKWSFYSSPEGSDMKVSHTWVQGDWSAKCSQECSGIEERAIVCQESMKNGIVKDELCSGKPPKPETKKCNTGCYHEWSIVWSKCSSTCGSSKKVPDIQCLKRSDGRRPEEADHSKCSHINKPVVKEQACPTKPCPVAPTAGQSAAIFGQWRTGQWGQCSASCGRGVQRRSRGCADYKRRRLVAEQHCNQRSSPPTERECLLRHCEDYKWKATVWTICSKLCGKGVQTRRLVCVDSKDTPVGDRQCSNIARPALSIGCTGEICGSWQKGLCSKCSASCGESWRQCQVRCVNKGNKVIDLANCIAASKPDGREKCVYKNCPAGHWTLSEWSSCSATCGFGVRRQSVVCQSRDGSQLPDSECNGSEKLSPKTEKCKSRVICHRWKAGEWSQCSKTCGKGNSQRQVKCYDSNERVVSDTFCDPSNRPVKMRKCKRACPKWVTERFHDCSVTCGRGVKLRRVYCRGAYQKELDESFCSHLQKPKAQKPCRQISCPVWRPSGWSACSQTCGVGMRMRTVVCRRGSKVVDAALCGEMPRSQERCQVQRCVSPHVSKSTEQYTWRTGGWTQCPAQCNPGVKRRKVACFSAVIGGEVDGSMCSGPPPPDTLPCECGTCGQWKTGQWSTCSVSCGTGMQSRSVRCVSEGGEVLPDSQCCLKYRPTSTQPCHERECSMPTSCKGVQELLKTKTDGLYLIKVSGGKRIEVFCDGMDTYHPVEYITLHPNASNFGKIYPHTLLNPSACPSDVSEQSPSIRRNSFAGAGYTAFDRVQLDLDKMEIITNDFKFARHEGSNRFVEYGSAGDCFSSTKLCPMGTFKIDLRKTGLKLDSRNEWVEQGGDTVKDIKVSEDDEVVSGRCGGFCGQCRLKNSRLKVVVA